jgi:hypothetical protein
MDFRKMCRDNMIIMDVVKYLSRQQSGAAIFARGASWKTHATLTFLQF